MARVRSDQAKEFLSHMVMEWLKEQGIRQTFTSTYDSQANGVAERWSNLIKIQATVLLASKHMHTSFWCYAVAWIATIRRFWVKNHARTFQSLDNFRLLLVRTKRNHKLEERGTLIFRMELLYSRYKITLFKRSILPMLHQQHLVTRIGGS